MTAIPLNDVPDRHCRWSVNEPAKGEVHLFCAEPSATGKPYCAAHCRLAYRAKPASPLKAAA